MHQSSLVHTGPKVVLRYVSRRLELCQRCVGCAAAGGCGALTTLFGALTFPTDVAPHDRASDGSRPVVGVARGLALVLAASDAAAVPTLSGALEYDRLARSRKLRCEPPRPAKAISASIAAAAATAKDAAAGAVAAAA